jgi:CBS domain containing-hemolysin-like protein
MLALILGVIVVLVGSALCSGAEAVLFSVSTTRVRVLAEKGSAAGAALRTIKENMGRPIATIVVLNNIFNIVGSMVVGSIAALQFGSTVFGVFSAALTFGVIVFSEIIPKTVGERNADRLGPVIALPILWLTRILTPVTFLIEKLVAPLTKGEKRTEVDEAEITLLANLGSEGGQILTEESEMIARVFRLNDVNAESIMTPRVSIAYIHLDQTLEQARDAILRANHSRILLAGEDIDEIQGYALRSELYAALIRGQGERPIADFRRDIQMVPPSLRADELLRRFRERREHIAVVLDEYGGVKGIVTMEDVLEVLTGPIVDETDVVESIQELTRRMARVRRRFMRR